jgi:hypothetical protein
MFERTIIKCRALTVGPSLEIRVLRPSRVKGFSIFRVLFRGRGGRDLWFLVTRDSWLVARGSFIFR